MYASISQGRPGTLEHIFMWGGAGDESHVYMGVCRNCGSGEGVRGGASEKFGNTPYNSVGDTLF